MGEKKRVSNAAGKKKANQNTAKNGRRPSSGRKRRRGMTANQFILIMAVVVGIILVFTVSKIMQNRYMKVTKIGSEYAPGTPFEDIPDDWVCPICGLGKDVFEELSE